VALVTLRTHFFSIKNIKKTYNSRAFDLSTKEDLRALGPALHPALKALEPGVAAKPNALQPHLMLLGLAATPHLRILGLARWVWVRLQCHTLTTTHNAFGFGRRTQEQYL